jgi:hypothetical protein
MDPLKLSRPFLLCGSLSIVVEDASVCADSEGRNSKETSLLLENLRPMGDRENEFER